MPLGKLNFYHGASSGDQHSLEILEKANDLQFSLLDVEKDLLFVLDFQSDMLMALQTQPRCNEEK